MFLRVIITEVVEDPDILSSSLSYTPLTKINTYHEFGICSLKMQ